MAFRVLQKLRQPSIARIRVALLHFFGEVVDLKVCVVGEIGKHGTTHQQNSFDWEIGGGCERQEKYNGS